MSALNIHPWGAMGSVAVVGLGLAAVGLERPSLVVTGDDEPSPRVLPPRGGAFVKTRVRQALGFPPA